MWDNLTPEEKESEREFFEKTKKRTTEEKYSDAEQEKIYRVLLNDVEDAMLAEEPRWRYVSAPFFDRVIFWVFRNLPESLTYKLTSRKRK